MMKNKIKLKSVDYFLLKASFHRKLFSNYNSLRSLKQMVFNANKTALLSQFKTNSLFKVSFYLRCNKI